MNECGGKVDNSRCAAQLYSDKVWKGALIEWWRHVKMNERASTMKSLFVLIAWLVFKKRA